MIDLLIKNGLVIDGTGSPGFYAAVLVDGDTVTIRRGDASGIEAARRSTHRALSSAQAS